MEKHRPPHITRRPHSNNEEEQRTIGPLRPVSNPYHTDADPSFRSQPLQYLGNTLRRGVDLVRGLPRRAVKTGGVILLAATLAGGAYVTINYMNQPTFRMVEEPNYGTQRGSLDAAVQAAQSDEDNAVVTDSITYCLQQNQFPGTSGVMLSQMGENNEPQLRSYADVLERTPLTEDQLYDVNGSAAVWNGTEVVFQGKVFVPPAVSDYPGQYGHLESIGGIDVSDLGLYVQQTFENAGEVYPYTAPCQ